MNQVSQRFRIAALGEEFSDYKRLLLAGRRRWPTHGCCRPIADICRQPFKYLHSHRSGCALGIYAPAGDCGCVFHQLRAANLPASI
jgi:hypothetical protein